MKIIKMEAIWKDFKLGKIFGREKAPQKRS